MFESLYQLLKNFSILSSKTPKGWDTLGSARQHSIAYAKPTIPGREAESEQQQPDSRINSSLPNSGSLRLLSPLPTHSTFFYHLSVFARSRHDGRPACRPYLNTTSQSKTLPTRAGSTKLTPDMPTRWVFIDKPKQPMLIKLKSFGLLLSAFPNLPNLHGSA